MKAEEAVPLVEGVPDSPAAAAEVEAAKKAAQEAAKKDPASQEAKQPELQENGERMTTTQVRQAMKVPSNVHVTIDSKNLIDYVGPPVYQRERMYTKQSPPGVATGLGYLGNGSGSVCQSITRPSCVYLAYLSSFLGHAHRSDRHAWFGHPAHR